MKVAVYKILTSVTALIVAFLLGVLSSSIGSRLMVSRKSEPASPIEIRVEQWHRLYEAAGMTGDSEVSAEVINRLICTDRSGESPGVMVFIKRRSWCRLDDGRMKEFDGNEYGSFSERILKSHLDWSFKNLDFVESVGSAAKARQYIREHRWPQ